MKKTTYFIVGKGKVAVISTGKPIPKKELYQRIFLPGKVAIENVIRKKVKNNS